MKILKEIEVYPGDKGEFTINYESHRFGRVFVVFVEMVDPIKTIKEKEDS